MATFCCPIETEPKTMNQVELNQAREVAVGVLKENEPSEASRILNEGMKPVIGIEAMAKVIERKDTIDKLQGTNTTSEAICQCSTNGVLSTPDQFYITMLRQLLSDRLHNQGFIQIPSPIIARKTDPIAFNAFNAFNAPTRAYNPMAHERPSIWGNRGRTCKINGF